MQVKERNQYLDAIKACASIFVVLIHCMFPGEVGVAFRALARFAVPLFFMVSGYFLWNEDRSKMNASIPRKIKRLLWIILISWIGYFILAIAENAFLGGEAFSLKGYLLDLFSWENFLRFFLTNTPLVYLPRWFLYALIYCYLFMLLPIKTKNSNTYILQWIGIILLLGYFALEYAAILYGLDIGFMAGDSDIYVRLRNVFLFRALPWFVLGMTLKHFRAKVEKIDIKIYWLLCVAGAVATIVQALFMDDAGIYVGTLMIIIGLFGIAMKKKNEECNPVITHIGNKLSLYIYVLHGAVISAASLLERLLFGQEGNTVYSWLKPIIVICGSIIGAEVFYLLSVKIGKKEKNENG